jgi:MFS family permease
MTVSLVGDGVFLVAIAWQAYILSNTPTALSIVGVAIAVPHITCLLLGGVVTDRYPRRRIMLFSDLVRGLAIGLVAFLSATGDLSLFSLAALCALYGAGTAFFGPAFDAIVVDIVPARSLAQANSLDQLVRPLAFRLVGPALGGVLIGAWGTAGAFALDAATFAVSAGSLWLMNVDISHGGDDRQSLMKELRSGFSYVRSQVWLWATFAAAALSYLLFMGPIEVLVPFIVKNDLAGGASDVGWIFAAGGVGAMAGALFVGVRAQPRRNILFMYVAWALATVALAGYGLALVEWHMMIAGFLFNAFETAGTIVWATTKQRLVPPALLGRVSSLDWLISTALLPLSFALTGPAAAYLGSRTTLVGAGVLGALITLSALFVKGMRDREGETGFPSPLAPRPEPLLSLGPMGL